MLYVLSVWRVIRRYAHVVKCTGVIILCALLRCIMTALSLLTLSFCGCSRRALCELRGGDSTAGIQLLRCLTRSVAPDRLAR